MLIKAIGLPLGGAADSRVNPCFLTRREELRFIPSKQKYFFRVVILEIPIAQRWRDANNGSVEKRYLLP